VLSRPDFGTLGDYLASHREGGRVFQISNSSHFQHFSMVSQSCAFAPSHFWNCPTKYENLLIMMQIEITGHHDFPSINLAMDLFKESRDIWCPINSRASDRGIVSQLSRLEHQISLKRSNLRSQ
jgi:hypothetical protein